MGRSETSHTIHAMFNLSIPVISVLTLKCTLSCFRKSFSFLMLQPTTDTPQTDVISQVMPALLTLGLFTSSLVLYLLFMTMLSRVFSRQVNGVIGETNSVILFFNRQIDSLLLHFLILFFSSASFFLLRNASQEDIQLGIELLAAWWGLRAFWVLLSMIGFRLGIPMLKLFGCIPSLVIMGFFWCRIFNKTWLDFLIQ